MRILVFFIFDEPWKVIPTHQLTLPEVLGLEVALCFLILDRASRENPLLRDWINAAHRRRSKVSHFNERREESNAASSPAEKKILRTGNLERVIFLCLEISGLSDFPEDYLLIPPTAKRNQEGR